MSGRAKLSEKEIIEIRARFRQGLATRKELAYEFKVSAPYISRIVLGRRRV